MSMAQFILVKSKELLPTINKGCKYCMEKEQWNTLMDLSILDNGLMVNSMEEGKLYSIMEMCTKECFKLI